LLHTWFSDESSTETSGETPAIGPTPSEHAWPEMFMIVDVMVTVAPGR
jgi:hypothetical protein